MAASRVASPIISPEASSAPPSPFPPGYGPAPRPSFPTGANATSSANTDNYLPELPRSCPTSIPARSQGPAAAPSTAKRHAKEDGKPMKFNPGGHLTRTASIFFTWKRLQEVVLRGYNWLGHVNGSDPCPDPMLFPREFRAWRKVDALVKAQIALNMDRTLYEELSAAAVNASDIWRLVNAYFEPRSILLQTAAKARLYAKRIEVGESMKNHVIALRQLRAEFARSGGELSSTDWHAIILQSLADHPEWKLLVICGVVTHDAEDLISTLELQEALGFGSTEKIETAVKVNTQGRGRRGRSCRSNANFCPNCKRGVHTIEQCWAPGGGAVNKRPANYKVPTELLDRERANFTAQIHELERRRASLANASPASSTVPEPVKVPSVTKPILHFVITASEPTHIPNCSWLLISNASSHMARERTDFSSYMPINAIEIHTACKGSTLHAIGKGTIILRFEFRGQTREIPVHEVLHVPDLTHNLLSLAKLDERGFAFQSSSGKCIISKDGCEFAEGTTIENRWVVCANVITDSPSVTHLEPEAVPHRNDRT